MNEIIESKTLEEKLKSRINPRCINCRPLIMAIVKISEVSLGVGASDQDAQNVFDDLIDDNCSGPRPEDELTSCSMPNCGHSKGATFLIKQTREFHANKEIFPNIG